MAFTVVAMALAAGAGVLLAAFDRPGAVRRALVHRLSLALVVAVAATLAAGLMSLVADRV